MKKKLVKLASLYEDAEASDEQTERAAFIELLKANFETWRHAT